MCGVSGIEFMVILVVAVIVLGPDRLPEVMRTLGEMARELRKITDDFSEVRDEFTKGIREDVEKDISQPKTSANTAKRRAKAGRAGQDVPEIDAIRAKRAQSTSGSETEASSTPSELDAAAPRSSAASERPLPPTIKPAAGVVESQADEPATRTADVNEATEASASTSAADAPSATGESDAQPDIESDSGKDA